MTTYVPILKGKPGEFYACRNASSEVLSGSRVVMEVVPIEGIQGDLSKFVKGVIAHWPKDYVLTVDTGSIDQTLSIGSTSDASVMWTANRLHERGVKCRPVMRLDDDDAVLAEVAEASTLHGEGACLRVGSEESYPDPADCEALLKDALSGADLRSDEVHLLIDLRSIGSAREIPIVVPPALAILAWAHTNGPWASVTIASGAFPASISNLPTGVASSICRFDADLFDAVINGGPDVLPDFGDYAVAHPSMPTPVPRGPLPNLRYAADREWQIYREARALPGNESFFTLCQSVVSSTHWPAAGAAYSWGNSEIARCATGQGGAGTATQWRAYGTSRHMAHVIDRLATHGAP